MTRLRSIGAITLALAGLALGGNAEAQISRKGNGYLMRMKFTKGQVTRYNISTDVAGAPSQPNSAEPAKINIVIPLKQTVLDVVKGIAEVQVVMGQALMNGKPMTQGGLTPGQTITVKVDSAGKPVGASNNDLSVGAKLPDKPIKVGESYSAALPMRSMGNQKVMATYTLKGIKKVDGKSVAELAVTVQPSRAGLGTGSGTILLLLSDASLWKANMLMSVSPGGGNGTQGARPMKLTVSIVRA